jgi:hypothetical protein
MEFSLRLALTSLKSTSTDTCFASQLPPNKAKYYWEAQPYMRTALNRQESTDRFRSQVLIVIPSPDV